MRLARDIIRDVTALQQGDLLQLHIFIEEESTLLAEESVDKLLKKTVVLKKVISEELRSNDNTQFSATHNILVDEYNTLLQLELELKKLAYQLKEVRICALTRTCGLAS